MENNLSINHDRADKAESVNIDKPIRQVERLNRNASLERLKKKLWYHGGAIHAINQKLDRLTEAVKALQSSKR